MNRNQRMWSFGLVLMLCTVIGMALPVSAAMDNQAKPLSSPSNSVLIGTVGTQFSGKLAKMGINVVQTYDSYVYAEVTPGQQKMLSEYGLTFSSIKDRTTLDFGNVKFDTTKGAPVLPAQYTVTASDSYDMYVVQLVGPVKSEWKADLRNLGATVYDDTGIYQFAYHVKMSPATAAKVAALPEVQYVGTYQPYYKIMDQSLFTATGTTKITIHYFATSDELKLIYDLTGLKIQAVCPQSDFLTADVVCSANLIPTIASLPEVKWIYEQKTMEPISTYDSIIVNPLNIRAGEYCDDAHLAWSAVLNGLGIALTGTGQIIGIADTGFDTGSAASGHYDFTRGPLASPDRLVAISGGADTDGHGTHCSGIAVGNGWCSLKAFGIDTTQASNYPLGFAGAAPEAKLTLYAGLTNTNWATMYSAGARIFSNSWGSSGTLTYDSTVDTFMGTGHTDALVFFAAGNDGPASNTVSAPSTCWNGVCVGAGENYRPEDGNYGPNAVASFSSRGPGWNAGLVKPDICATGDTVVSTVSSKSTTYGVGTGYVDPVLGLIDKYPDTPDGIGDYIAMSGTSMASPRAAGLTLLIRQFYMAATGGGWPNGLHTPTAIADPDPVLLKATLIHGAVDMGMGFPSFVQGWGRADIRNSLFPVAPTTNQWAEHSFTSSGQTWNVGASSPDYIQTNVSSTRVPLKVTLVWPNTATSSLANDLNLVVTDPSGNKYMGNLFNAGTSQSTMNPSGSADSANNVEIVNIITPVVGQWKIAVTSAAVSGSSCKCALLVASDIGPQSTYSLSLSSTDSKQYVQNAGDTVTYHLNVLNFGTATQAVTLSNTFTYPTTAPTGWTFGYTPSPWPSNPSVPSNTPQAVTVSIAIPASASPGTYALRFVGVEGTVQSKLDIQIYVKEPGLPTATKLTGTPGNNTLPCIFANVSSGTSYLIIAYEHDDGTTQTVMAIVSNNGGSTWSSPITIDSLNDGPNDIRVTMMPSTASTHAYRAFITWTGTDPALISAETGSWSELSYADPPYTTWTMSSARTTNVNVGTQAINVKRMTFGLPDPRDSTLWLVFEHLDSTSKTATNPSYVGTEAMKSSDGGATWGTPASITPSDSNYYFFPNGADDKQGVPWVSYYWRTSTGNVRSISITNYNKKTASAWSAKVDVLTGVASTTYQNCMFPVPFATTEGANSNRLYDAFTTGLSSGALRRIYVLYTDDQGTTWTGVTGGAPTLGPYGESVSEAGDLSGPVLNLAWTSDKTIWMTYLDLGPTRDPYNGISNVFVTSSTTSFAAGSYQMGTADGFMKEHPTSAAIGTTLYTAYSSYDATSHSDIWLIHFGTLQTGWITGTVTDSGTSAPIVGATVTAGTASGPTDASGKYNLTVTTGTWPVVVTKTGYTSVTKPGIVVTANTATICDVQMTATVVPFVFSLPAIMLGVILMVLLLKLVESRKRKTSEKQDKT